MFIPKKNFSNFKYSPWILLFGLKLYFNSIKLCGRVLKYTLGVILGKCSSTPLPDTDTDTYSLSSIIFLFTKSIGVFYSIPKSGSKRNRSNRLLRDIRLCVTVQGV